MLVLLHMIPPYYEYLQGKITKTSIILTIIAGALNGCLTGLGALGALGAFGTTFILAKNGASTGLAALYVAATSCALPTSQWVASLGWVDPS